MDLFNSKLQEFLKEKTEIVRKYVEDSEKERRELGGNVVEEAGLTYDMNQFMKSVREFEAEQKKQSKKRVKDNADIPNE